MTTFPPDSPMIYGSTTVPSVPPPGTEWTITWIAEQVAGSTPPNTTIDSSRLPTEQFGEDVNTAGRTYTVNYHISRPTAGWPVGSYRVEVQLAGETISTTRFQVAAGGSSGGGPSPGQVLARTCSSAVGGACVTSETTFRPDTAVIYGSTSVPSVPPPDTEVTVTWIAERVGNNPPDTIINTSPIAVHHDGPRNQAYTIHYNMTPPTAGWPVGSYRVEVQIAGETISSTRFQVVGG